MKTYLISYQVNLYTEDHKKTRTFMSNATIQHKDIFTKKDIEDIEAEQASIELKIYNANIPELPEFAITKWDKAIVSLMSFSELQGEPV